MPAEITVHGFETSNNIKVRIGLGYKGIPYAFRTIDPADRGEIIRISGQRLTPVMVHGNRVLFDSAAILRYLEANFPGKPPLFGSSMQEQWAIEDLELFARHALAGPMMEVVHHRVGGGKVDEAMQARCQESFGQAVDRLAAALGEQAWLVGDALSVADITAAAVMYRIRSGRIFELPAAASFLADWERRVLAHDRLRPPS